MIGSFLALGPSVSLSFLFLAVLLSSAGAPVPGAVALLLAGAMIKIGELDVIWVFVAAVSGSVTGDQIGYQLGFRAGNLIEKRLSRKPSRAAKIAKAKTAMRKQGGWSIYFSRWLLTPLGPTLNLIAGASDMRWARFTMWSMAGEITWVCVLVPIGYIFVNNIERTSRFIIDAIWVITAGVVIIYVVHRLWKRAQERKSS